MPEDEDQIAALLRRTAARDRAAFRRLYDLTAPRQFAIAMRVLGRRDLAEEAVQDAYVSVWQSADAFRPGGGSAQGWITAILRRRAIDRLRASPWLAREVAAEAPEPPPSPDAPEEALALHRCLGALSAPVRRAIRLAYLYGMTHRELSDALGLPLGTLKSRLRRGLAALKECLEG